MPKAVEKHAGDARVLAGDDVGGGQRRERAERGVAEIADRGRHNIEPGFQRLCRDPVALDGEGMGGLSGLPFI